jgi:hypothetical protein
MQFRGKGLVMLRWQEGAYTCKQVTILSLWPALLLLPCVPQVTAYRSHCDYEKQLSEAQAYLKEVQGDPEMAEFAREEIADLQVRGEGGGGYSRWWQPGTGMQIGRRIGHQGRARGGPTLIVLLPARTLLER